MSSIFDTLSLSVRLVNASICSSSFSCSIISLLAFHLNSSQVISSFWTLSFPTYFLSRPSLSHTSISYPFSLFPFPFPFPFPAPSLYSAFNLSSSPSHPFSFLYPYREEFISITARDILSKIPLVSTDIGSYDLLQTRAKLLIRNSNEVVTPCQVVLLQELER